MFGILEIEGKKYIERSHTFTAQEVITAANQIVAPARLVLPGVAGFLLKALARESIAAGVIVARRFRFKFGNTDGGLWYASGGVGGASDRVVDTLIFGNGQFPFPIVPHIYYSPNANITYEYEDLAAPAVPYTTFFAFIGSYLIPVD